jgi:hypothetical protein
MRTKKFFFLLVLIAAPLLGKEEKKWSVETELIQPFIPTVHIGRIHLTRTIWGDWTEAHGEIKIGAFIRPRVKHDVVDVIDEYAASFGYRHFFDANWTIEANYYIGYVWADNNKWNRRYLGPYALLAEAPEIRAYAFKEVEKDYEGRVQFAEALVGYRFFLNEEKSIYLLPQFGVIHGLHGSNIIGPRDGKTETFLEGNLIIGTSI